MKIWVALPAYNEAPRLPKLLDRWESVLTKMDHEHAYVIVDDGSTDETPAILTRFAENHPLQIITHHPNMGLGASLRDGLNVSSQQASPTDVIVTMDADNTQPPELVPDMLSQMNRTNCDVVIASRYRSGARVEDLSATRRFMSFGARALFQACFPIRGVRDYTCGFRVYRAAIIQKAFKLYGDTFCDRPGFECTADILLRLAKVGATFSEVGMVLNYADKAGSSSMRVGHTVRKTIELMLARRFERKPSA
jgi:dolichol-phosphate mannosyltransferase